ncbi:complement factor H like 2 precursor [Danio rerio]|uniref:Complement factor H like 2 precursor n=1 Tax=Danio rerio TaxID=7955 RepID=Q5U3W5_DANRE|nr:complement factor H like 2 precursor [Danio rerio]AAH85367.1 Zgc:101554 [Danio rerio]|eukprot:NP_001007419.1 complement factor H like 2 precursor [Danio rerio]
MNVPAKLLGFVVWLLCLNCGQCEDCLGTDINYENVEPVLEWSYPDGITVRVTCQTGYTGMYRLRCEDGKWSENIARPCAKKRCSHPGEAANADFKLLDGTEYVFGTTVVYTCKKGYKMKSRINHRTCRSQGWDNAIPVCEAVTCELTLNYEVKRVVPEGKTIFRAGERLTITRTEKTWFRSKETIKTFACQDDGTWDSNPGCEGMCARPDIPNAKIIGVLRQSYSTNSTIRYKCNPGFEPEETVQITCDHQAQWTGLQQCTAKQEVCPDVHVKNGFSQPLNKTVIFYACNKGYKPFNGEWWSSVTCVKGSWSDVPLCIRKEECGAFPSVQNGKLKLKDQETAEIDCDPGFISSTPSIKCNNGTWETPTCNEGVRCGIPPYVDNSVIISKPEVVYIHGSSVTYTCRSPFVMIGKSTVFCSNGKWEETPTCEARCLRPLENYMSLANDKDTYQDKEILNYQCLKPYDKIPEGEWICDNGKWTGDFVCTSDICPPPPYIENGSHFSRNPDDKMPTEVYYECQAYYVLSERKQYYRCENGRWRTPPKCLKPCQITQDILEAHNMRPDQQTGYIKHGDYVDYYCQHRLIVRTGHYKKATCSDGKLEIESCE